MPQNYNKFVSLLITLSPAARDKLENEKYSINLEDYDDDDLSNIAGIAFEAAALDLESMGVKFTVPYSDVYSSAYLREEATKALRYVFPNTLFYLLKQDSTLLERLNDILTGGVDDGDTISIWMNFLGGYNGTRPAYTPDIAEGANYLAVSLSSDSTFDDYLRNIISLIKTEKKEEDQSPEDLTFLTAFRQGLTYAYGNAVSAIAPLVEGDLIASLEKRILIEISRLGGDISASQARWLFGTQTQTLHDDLKKAHALSLKGYFVSSKLCPSYTESRFMDRTPLDYLGYLCYWWVGYQHNPDKFLKTASAYFEKHPYSPASDLMTALYKAYTPE